MKELYDAINRLAEAKAKIDEAMVGIHTAAGKIIALAKEAENVSNDVQRPVDVPQDKG